MPEPARVLEEDSDALIETLAMYGYTVDIIVVIYAA